MTGIIEALFQEAEALGAGHVELSLISSAVDDPHVPNERLLDIALRAAARARHIALPTLDARPAREPRYYQHWPGEHYRLLAALVAELAATTVIEIGSSTGMGTLALAEYLPKGGQVVTFDIQPWSSFDHTWFVAEDFADGHIDQRLCDLSVVNNIDDYRPLFAKADLIFIDGPKDGVMEPALERVLEGITFSGTPLIVFDDIRVVHMLAFWRHIRRPKLDLTSFGHWSGTGLVDWCG